MSPHLWSGPVSGKTGPVWDPWPCWMIEAGAVLSNTYGSRIDASRWQ